jgi:hypothetical protein
MATIGVAAISIQSAASLQAQCTSLQGQILSQKQQIANLLMYHAQDDGLITENHSSVVALGIRAGLDENDISDQGTTLAALKQQWPNPGAAWQQFTNFETTIDGLVSQQGQAIVKLQNAGKPPLTPNNFMAPDPNLGH